MSGITTPSESRAGLWVFYKLSQYDAKDIVQKRRVAGIATASGNEPREGDEYPALIVRDHAQYELRKHYDAGERNLADGTILSWDDYLMQSTCNLQVFLDGNDVWWATSRTVFNPAKHGDWRALPEDQEPQTISEEQGIWTPDARGHWFEL